MNYPVWDIPLMGSGLVVALIATIHVLISHLAVGGGAFLLGTEIWADRQPDRERVLSFLHGFGTFFLVFTTVFGAITGVGIWFSIQLANPEGTSLLIHQFVFAWAIEWVMFLAELSVLYLYYYGFGRSSRAMQKFLAGAYFVIAWLSLFVINGILTFMMTPGAWTLDNGAIAEGFFNPGYVPSLLLRTVIMFVIAGLGGLLVASRLDDPRLKDRVVSFASKWVIPAALLAPFLTYWYSAALPESALKILSGGVTGLEGGKLEIATRVFWLSVLSGALIVIGVFVVNLRARALTFAAALALMLVAFLGVLGGEFFREMARKPYVIHGVLYSNSLWKNQTESLTRMNSPFLSNARWHPAPEPLSREHGEWAFRLQCAACHTREGYRSVAYRTRAWTPEFGYEWFTATMPQQGVMPPFQGDSNDKAALTSYLLSLQGQIVTPQEVLDRVAAKERKAREEEEAAKAAREKKKEEEAGGFQPPPIQDLLKDFLQDLRLKGR